MVKQLTYHNYVEYVNEMHYFYNVYNYCCCLCIETLIFLGQKGHKRAYNFGQVASGFKKCPQQNHACVALTV